MTPVFANSAWISTRERFILRNGVWRKRWLKVRYGVFVHPDAGPVLIDTGYTVHSVQGPGRSRWLRAYGRAFAPKLNDDAQPQPFLSRFGLAPRDITTVIVTHFHADHVSGLSEFPNAQFMCSRAAWASLQRNGNFQNIRHGVFAELLPDDFATRLTPVEDRPRQGVQHLPDGYDLFGDGSVLSVPLPGHAAGHFGLLFPQLKEPLLYATDTQWVIDALPRAARPCLMPRLLSDDYDAMRRSTDHVQAFRNSGGRVMLCHDDAPSLFDVEEGAYL
ncbi:MBL fold metallo-hydrolase [Ruegeria arenilitoris]|uniref:MBL fold metallo-hydrolase n=1 Tax=Ruegeria arenilitoris TaxID=1173585 RepID=UPI00147DF893|nr:MBL fold metallo-hydrolase [Ruegeria arenilitoris]